ncbi:MAG: hypothetical protein WA369_11795 [Candidatus Acidiferrales bacterium]
MQRLDAFGALVERSFRFALAATFVYSTGIFSAAKLCAQLFCSALSNRKPNADASGCDYGDNNDDDTYLRGAHP